MAWKVELTRTAEKQLKKLDRQWQKRILDYLEYKVAVLDDPRFYGRGLRGELKGMWRYRVGDYRVICRIEDENFVILAVLLGHRKDVYEPE